MTTAARRLKTAPFRRASVHRACLIASVLAIMAGIFGMHVMTGGNHGHHSPAMASAPAATPYSTTAAQADQHTAGQHTAGQHTAGHGTAGGHTRQPTAAHGPGPAAEFQHASLPQPDSCTCSMDCGGHSMAIGCVPSAKAGSLAAPQPGTMTMGFSTGCSAEFSVTASYTYLPGGPSPGELSISRT